MAQLSDINQLNLNFVNDLICGFYKWLFMIRIHILNENAVMIFRVELFGCRSNNTRFFTEDPLFKEMVLQ